MNCTKHSNSTLFYHLRVRLKVILREFNILFKDNNFPFCGHIYIYNYTYNRYLPIRYYINFFTNIPILLFFFWKTITPVGFYIFDKLISHRSVVVVYGFRIARIQFTPVWLGNPTALVGQNYIIL